MLVGPLGQRRQVLPAVICCLLRPNIRSGGGVLGPFLYAEFQLTAFYQPPVGECVDSYTDPSTGLEVDVPCGFASDPLSFIETNGAMLTAYATLPFGLQRTDFTGYLSAQKIYMYASNQARFAPLPRRPVPRRPPRPVAAGRATRVAALMAMSLATGHQPC